MDKRDLGVRAFPSVMTPLSMFIEPLGQQIAVCSFEGAARLIKADKGYWNVVSICGPFSQRPDFQFVKNIHYACFDDIEVEGSSLYRSPRAEDIADIFAFIGSLGEGPPLPPLLIHCGQGLSRSTAVALSWIYGRLPASARRLPKAIDLILELQPLARPNRLVLSFGLAQFCPAAHAHEIAERMINEPRLARNRFRQSAGEEGEECGVK